MNPKYPLRAVDTEGISTDVNRIIVPSGSITGDTVNLSGASNVFNIADYGAKVDGVSNDSPAVQAALNAAMPGGGGIIYFPPGTTRLQTTVQMLTGNAAYIFQGSSGASRIYPKMDSGQLAFYFGNTNQVTFSDLMFIGGVTDGHSSSDWESSSVSIIEISTTMQASFQRCSFFGVGCSAGPLISANAVPLSVTDCYFAACPTPVAGNISLYNVPSFEINNTLFIDYAEYDGVFWNKFGYVGNTQSWISGSAPGISMGNGGPRPTYILNNCLFDENNTNGLVNLSGTSALNVSITNCSFNSGFGDSTTVKLSNFRKVTVKDTFSGLSSAPSNNCNALQLTNVGAVELDNFNTAYSSKYISLEGTTSRLKMRDSYIQGNVTYPLGTNNPANALIDADTPMPTSASAAALVPLGMTTHVTGTTTITSITTTNFKDGDVLKLIFDSTAQVTDGSNIRLASNFTGGANRVLTLLFDGGNFYEMSRSAN